MDVTINITKNNEFIWYEISRMELSDEFIEKYARQLNWDVLCAYSIFSAEFIEKMNNYINFDILASRRLLSHEQLYKYRDKLTMNLVEYYYNKDADIKFINENMK